MRLSKPGWPLRTTLLYLLFGSIWILLSDQLLSRFILHDPQQAFYQTLKGWLFIVVSGIVLYLVLRQDHAQQQHADVALRESEERFRLMFEANPVVMMLIEPASGAIRNANQAAAAFYGYPVAELCRMNINEINQLSPDEVKAERMRALHEQRNFFNFQHRLSTGEIRFVEVYSAPIKFSAETLLFSIVHDISERTKAQQELHDIQNRMQAIVTSAMDAILSIDTDQKIVLSNPAAEQMFGYSKGDLVGKPLDMLLPERSRQAHREHVRQFGSTGTTTRSMHSLGEVYGLRADGREFPAEASISQISMSSEKIYTVILRDVTARRQAEQEIESMAKFPQENTGTVLRIGRDGTLLFGNRASRSLLDQWGCKVGDRLPEEIQHIVDQTLTNSRSQEIEVSHGDATESLMFIPIVDKAYVNVYGRDVTERKQAEQRFRLVIESAPNAIVLVNQNGLIEMVNSQTERFFGYTRSELLGRKVDTLVPERLRAVHADHRQEYLEELLARPMGIGRDLYGVRKDGSEFPIEIGLTPIRTEERVLVIATIVDITERRQAEEHIRFQSSLLENVSDAIIGTDVAFRVLTWNPAAEQIYGWTAQEILGKPVNEVLETTYETATSDEVIHHFQARGEWKGEAIQRRKDRSRITVLSSVSQIKDGNGTIIGVAAINRDITDRKHAERKLRESQEEFRSLFEDSPICLWLEDFSAVKRRLHELKEKNVGDVSSYLWQHPEFVRECAGLVRVLDVNSAGVKLYHARSKSELLGSLINVLPAFSLEQFTHELILLDSGQLNFEREGVDKTLTGEQIYVSLRWTVAPGYEDSLARVIISTLDITARRQAEQKLQHQVERLSALRAIDMAISSSFDMKVSLNVLLREAQAQQGVDAAAILLIDSSGVALEYAAGIGFRSTAIEHSRIHIGEGLAGRVALERLHIYIPDLNEAGSAIVRDELMNDEHFHAYFAVPLVAKGELKGVLEIFHRSPLQVTPEWLDFLETLGGQATIAIENAQLLENLHRSNTELEHRVAERTSDLERANRTKDEFLANMSHELRTPLNSILGLSESLLEQRRGALNEHQQNSLRIVTSSGQHLLDLINDILDLSKIEAGMLDFYPEPVLVDELCQSCLTFVKAQARKKSITLTYTSDAAPTRIYADPRRLKQILVNLLTNGVKFSPEHGQVTLHVSSDLEQDIIHFSVIDNGIGIAANDINRLFRPFVQVDSSLNRQYQGTGLGLALVQKLTDLHGGSIEVDSEVEKGSRFTVNLPCNMAHITKLETSPTQPVPESKTQAQLAPKSRRVKEPGEVILLVDDNSANILTVGDYLESYEYEVVVAHDGLEAVQKAAEHAPQLIIMDIQMPVMNGLEAIAQLRADARFKETPIIALTALAMPGDRERCMAAGADEYMSKPASLKKLLQTIRQLVGQSNERK